jgi:hypothetical protein
MSDLLSALGRVTRAAACHRYLRLQASFCQLSADLRRAELEAEGIITLEASRREQLAESLLAADDRELPRFRGVLDQLLYPAVERIQAARAKIADIARERADLAAMQAVAIPTVIADLLLNASHCSGPPHQAPQAAVTTPN